MRDALDPVKDPDEEIESPELQEFLSKARDRDGPFKCELHRITKKPGNNREIFGYLRNWVNEIPDYEQIGELFGPGEFRRTVWYTSKVTKKRKFASERLSIDPDFGRNSPWQQGGTAVAAGSAVADSAMAMAMQVFAKAMEALTTIAQAAVSSKGENAAGNVGALAEQIGQLTMGMFTQQQKMIERIGEAQIDHLFGQEQPEPEAAQEEDPGIGSGIFELLRWLWRTYGEKLLGAAPFVQKIARERVSALPQLKELYKDPAALADAMTKLESQDGVPREHIDRVLGILGLTRPDSVIFSGGKAEEGPTA